MLCLLGLILFYAGTGVGSAEEGLRRRRKGEDRRRRQKSPSVDPKVRLRVK